MKRARRHRADSARATRCARDNDASGYELFTVASSTAATRTFTLCCGGVSLQSVARRRRGMLICIARMHGKQSEWVARAAREAAEERATPPPGHRAGLRHPRADGLTSHRDDVAPACYPPLRGRSTVLTCVQIAVTFSAAMSELAVHRSCRCGRYSANWTDQSPIQHRHHHSHHQQRGSGGGAAGRHRQRRRRGGATQPA